MRKIIKERQVLLRLPINSYGGAFYNMQKVSHSVCGMLFMLVGAEKKNMGWRNDILGPGKTR